jgi:hypothetical protein
MPLLRCGARELSGPSLLCVHLKYRHRSIDVIMLRLRAPSRLSAVLCHRAVRRISNGVADASPSIPETRFERRLPLAPVVGGVGKTARKSAQDNDVSRRAPGMSDQESTNAVGNKADFGDRSSMFCPAGVAGKGKSYMNHPASRPPQTIILKCD